MHYFGAGYGVPFSDSDIYAGGCEWCFGANASGKWDVRIHPGRASFHVLHAGALSCQAARVQASPPPILSVIGGPSVVENRLAAVELVVRERGVGVGGRWGVVEGQC